MGERDARDAVGGELNREAARDGDRLAADVQHTLIVFVILLCNLHLVVELGGKVREDEVLQGDWHAEEAVEEGFGVLLRVDAASRDGVLARVEVFHTGTRTVVYCQEGYAVDQGSRPCDSHSVHFSCSEALAAKPSELRT